MPIARLICLALPLLAACASAPQAPITSESSLLVFSTTVKQVGARRIPYFIYLKFRNTTSGETFDGSMLYRDPASCPTDKYIRVYVSDGLCNLVQSRPLPPGTYVLYGYSAEADWGMKTFNYRENRWNHTFTLQKGEVTYLGHITYNYSSGDTHASSLQQSSFVFTDIRADDLSRALKINPEVTTWKVQAVIPTEDAASSPSSM